MHIQKIGEMEMENNNWSFKPSDLYTIPNLLTYLRFILVAPFMYFFLQQNYIAAALCIGFSGLSDCFDGLLARKLNQVTSLGKILDPIADKVTLFTVALCMLIYIPSLLPLLAILMFKEVTMLFCGMILLIKKITPPPAKWYGKFATVVFYFSVVTIIFLKAVFNYESPVLIITLFVLTAVVMVFDLIKYAIIFFQLIKEKKK